MVPWKWAASQPSQDESSPIWHQGSAWKGSSGYSGIDVAGTVVPFHDTVKLLGVTLDSAVTLDRHVTQVLRCCSYHTRALRHIRPLLTFDADKTIAHSIVSSRLDYANALLHGLTSHRTHWSGRCARLHALPVPPSYVGNFIGCQFVNASPTR